MEINTDWHQWKNYLGKAINAGEFIGLSEKNLSNMAYQIGSFLSNKIDPGNREQRLLKELWDTGNEGERQALAGMIIKLVDHGGPDGHNNH